MGEERCVGGGRGRRRELSADAHHCCERQRERGDQEREPHRAELGERLQVQVVRVTRVVGGAAIAEPVADGNVDEEAGIDDEHEFVEADENVAEEEREKGKEKREAAVTQNGAGEERHRADGRKIPRMRSDAQGGGKHNQSESEQRAVKRIFFLGHFGVHFVASSICSNKSQNTKPSRFTTSPVRTGMGD